MLAIACVVQAVRARAAVDHDVALVEAERHFAGDRLLHFADEGHQGVHLRHVPEAVVHHLGHFGAMPIAQVDRLAVERELLDRQVGRVEGRHAGRLVHAAALHADEAVLDDVDPPHAVAAGDLVQLFDHRRAADCFSPLIVTGTPLSKPIVTFSTLSGASCGETVMPKSTIDTPSTAGSSSLPAS